MEYGSESTDRRINGCKHCVTTYLWFFAVIIFMGLPVLRPPSQYTDPVRSAKRVFNESEDPTYFVHLTDIHVSSYKEKSRANYEKALDFASSTLSEILISTGDLADDWLKHSMWKESEQNKDDHRMYRDISDGADPKLTAFIDQVGNHDMFDVFSYDSSNNNFIHYSKYFSSISNLSYENFTVSRFDAKNGMTFIVVNPIVFPASRALLDLFVQPTPELLDRVEEAIIGAKGRSIFLINHFPAYWWFNVRSSRGHTYRDINRLYDTSLALSGHTHPSNSIPLHHGQNLEVIGSDLTTHNHISIVSSDNGNIAYTQFSIEDTPRAIITNPIPFTQVSQVSTFNSNDIDIRLLVWANESVTIKANGCVRGTLEFVRRIKENLSLYHIKSHLENGKHSVSFSGDFDGNITFYIGDVLPSHYELLGNMYNFFFTVQPISRILIIFFAIILFPLFFEEKIPFLKKIMQRSIEWLFNDSYELSKTVFGVMGGYFFVRWRVMTAPLYLRIVLFASIFLPYICPVFIQQIDGHWGVGWIYGYTNGGRTTPSVWGPIFILAFMLFVICPITFMVSVLRYRRFWTRAFWGDIVYSCLGVVFCIAFSFIKISEATKIFLAMTSPIFVIAPILLVVALTMMNKFNSGEQIQSITLGHSSELLDNEPQEHI